MSPRLPILSGHEVVTALKRAQFVPINQRGSLKLRHADGRTVIGPIHPELALGTLSSILRKSQLTLEEFQRLL